MVLVSGAFRFFLVFIRKILGIPMTVFYGNPIAEWYYYQKICLCQLSYLQMLLNLIFQIGSYQYFVIVWIKAAFLFLQ